MNWLALIWPRVRPDAVKWLTTRALRLPHSEVERLRLKLGVGADVVEAILEAGAQYAVTQVDGMVGR